MASWTAILKSIKQEKAKVLAGVGQAMDKSGDSVDEPKKEHSVGKPPDTSEMIVAKKEESSEIKKTPNEFKVTPEPRKFYVDQTVDFNWDVAATIFKDARKSSTSEKEGKVVAQQESHFITSPKFSVTTLEGKKPEWTLLMNPCHISNGIQYISLHLQMCDLAAPPSSEFVDAVYELHILNGFGTTRYSRNMSDIRRFTKDKNNFGWSEFIKVDRLGVNPPDVIRIKAIVHLLTPSGPLLTKDSALIEEPMQIDEEPMIAVDDGQCAPYADLWGKTEGTDLKICVGEQLIPVHSKVLKASSQLFSIFINLDPTKDSFNMVGDLDIKIILGMLEFCYKGTTELFQEYNATLDLIKAARRYKIRGLEVKCIEQLMTMVNLGNFTTVYNLVCGKKRKEGLTEYSIGSFVRDVLKLRKDHPHVLTDFWKDPELAATLLFA